MPQKKKVLIVGLGNIGLLYDQDNISSSSIYTHSKAVHLHESFDLVGGVDKHQERLEIFKKFYNKETYYEIDKALKTEKPEIVIVSTPDNTHRGIIEQIVSLNCPKVILCEKTLGGSLEEGNKIIDICNKNNVDLYVNYIRRCDPGVIQVYKYIQQSIIATPIKGNCFYSKGMFNNCSHFINLLQYWLGKCRSHIVIKKGRVVNEAAATGY